MVPYDKCNPIICTYIYIISLFFHGKIYRDSPTSPMGPMAGMGYEKCCRKLEKTTGCRFIVTTRIFITPPEINIEPEK